MSESAPLPVASFKLSFVETRARIVPAADAAGRAFTGPGVDVVGPAARELLDAARPILAWLEAREPLRVRSLSFDLARARLLVTVEAAPRPRVIRIEPPLTIAEEDIDFVCAATSRALSAMSSSLPTGVS